MEKEIREGFTRTGVMTKTQVDDVLARQKAGDKRLFTEIAISLGYINEEALRLYVSTRLGCRFRLDCHFYNTTEKIAHYTQLKEFYCDEWPRRCAIYQQKAGGKPVSTSLLPTGVKEENREP